MKLEMNYKTWLSIAFVAGVIQAACANEQEQPNILFLFSDDQRWDSVGAYGNPQVTHTPHLDALAAEGTLFENAFVTYSICNASRTSMLTGRYRRSRMDRNAPAELTNPATGIRPILRC